jgi:hypothetical protein
MRHRDPFPLLRRIRHATLIAAALLAAGTVARAAESPPLSSSRYDTDYPTIPYAGSATHNAFARLQARMERGEVKLEYRPGRGYLDSLLKELKIDPSSQMLVYSKTSLQIDFINATTPRAIYFNDSTYVGFVQNAPLLELATIDDELGLVFYSMVNKQQPVKQFDREGGRCLTCHDTYSMMGGGIPRVVVMSALIDGPANPQGRETSDLVTDQTPLRDRWGGWYVTGEHGIQTHLGNLPTDNDPKLVGRSDAERFNLKSLDGWLDTKPYITNKSDVIALMVLEHQTNVQNFITRASFKVRTVLARAAGAGNADPRSWEEISSRNQSVLKAMIEPLVRTMFFVDAVQFTSPLAGTAGFEAWFQAQGPRDKQGRSLRQLELNSRLFRYPLSYMVYSESFDSLPEYVRQYVYTRIAEVLTGRDSTGAFEALTPEDRKDILEILSETKPDFVRMAAASLRAVR